MAFNPEDIFADKETAQTKLNELSKRFNNQARFIPLSAEEIKDLRKKISNKKTHKKGIERFLVDTEVLQDGKLLIIVNGAPLDISRTNFQLVTTSANYRQAVVVIEILTKNAIKSAVILEGTPEFDALKRGLLITAFVSLLRNPEIAQIDYSQTEHLEIISKISKAVELHNKRASDLPPFFQDENLTKLFFVAQGSATEQFTRDDWVQSEWIVVLAKLCDWLSKWINEISEDPADAISNGTLDDFPSFKAVAQILAEGRPKGSNILEAINYYAYSDNFHSGLQDLNLFNSRENIELDNSIVSYCSHVFASTVVSPVSSDMGRRLPFVSNGQLSYFDIDTTRMTVQKNEDVKNIWNGEANQIRFDCDKYLTPGDLPAGPELEELWNSHSFSNINPSEAATSTTQLLEEAVALRKWTIPQKAVVELRLGPFRSVEITEVNDFIHFLWRTENQRFAYCGLNLTSKRFSQVDIHTNNENIICMIKLVMAATIRDFLVAEERRKIFDVTRRRVTGRSFKGDGKETRYVYLPRIRYVSDTEAIKRIKTGLDQNSRSRHFVRSTFRRVKPSPLQLTIAKNEGIIVPEGYTYVRAHFRGGGEGQIIYRSKSATQLLFETDDRPLIQPEQDDWFEFEGMTATLLDKHLGFTVLSRAKKGGDGGVDILATKQHGKRTETWIVQCKCYSQNNPVGPSVIRELIGTIVDTPHENDEIIRGMVVTTSRFTPEATRLAITHSIQLIDHEALIDICAAINRTHRKTFGH